MEARGDTDTYESDLAASRVVMELSVAALGFVRVLGLSRHLRSTRSGGRAFKSLQLMTSLALGRTIANVNPPAAVPQITGADT
jgi:hypothetical protein